MASIGTFGSFTQARLGIYASHAGLSATGNNIANINTEGYTRQKLDQTSFYAGGSDRYYSKYDIRVGNGVLATGLSQLRDPYLDIRYRTEMADVGYTEARLSGLESIQHFLDEVGEGTDDFGILANQFSDFLDQLELLSDQTGLEEYDIGVRASAQTLTDIFHSYAKQLDQVYDNSIIGFEEDIKVVNEILTNIRDLNDSIRKAEVHGDNALELRDQRNELIDDLSSYMKINAFYTEEDIGGIKVEKLTIKLDDANPDPTSETDESVLVDGVYATQLSLTQVYEENPNYDPDEDDTDAAGFGRYLKADGTGTNNRNLANLVDSPNFNLTLDSLKDSKGRLMYTTEYTGTTTLTPDQVAGETSPLSTVNKDGTITLTTFNTSNPIKDNDGNITGYMGQVYTRTPSTSVDLQDNDLYGSLQGQREMLTERGEFATAEDLAIDPKAGTKRGIPFYQHALDLLANQFATIYNEANQGFVYDENGHYIREDGAGILTLMGQPISKDGLTAEQQEYINNSNYESIEDYLANSGAGAYSLGGALFDSGEEAGPITASNISITQEWQDGPLIVNSFEAVKINGEYVIGSTDSTNIAHMITLMDAPSVYDPNDVVPGAHTSDMFEGSFAEMWDNIGSTLGNDIQSTDTMLDVYYAQSLELDTSRDAVSSVDLNDEAMNLMQYSKSYNAACRLMTTIDSVLDKLINGTGVTV